MGKLRDRMEQDLKLGGYSPATQRIYLLYAREFARYHMRSPAEMGEEEIRAYLMHRIERQCSHETYRQVRAGLKFLYMVTLRRPIEVEQLPMRRKPARLPHVIGGTEVSALLESVTNMKYRAVLMTIEASGAATRLLGRSLDAFAEVGKTRCIERADWVWAITPGLLT